MHHEPVIHEVEAVGLCLIWVTNHLADCKRGPARAKVRNLSHGTLRTSGLGQMKHFREFLSFPEPVCLLVMGVVPGREVTQDG